MFLLTACGPENATDDETLAVHVQEIALNYQATNDLNAARTSLGELDVANANQWLLFATETAIHENRDANTIAAMIKLAHDLGLESTPINEYALQNNLLVAGSSLAQALKSNQEEAVATPIPTAVPTLPPTVAVAAPPTAAPTAIPTATAQTKPMVKANDALNVREGPSTNYNIVGSLQKDELVQITGKNPEGDWWQVLLANGATGWVFGQLTQTLGETAGVAVADYIPAEPVAVAAAPAAVEEAPPAEPAAEAAPPAPDSNAQPHFTLIQRRLWEKQENDGCVGKHLLRIHVVDANGVRLNGVRLKGIYIGEELVTGDQGKGDGIIEYDLHGSGEGFTVIRNDDGRESTSDRAEGFTTRSADIDEATLIEANYCTNHETCQIFYNSHGCQGHHSWEATFQRNY